MPLNHVDVLATLYPGLDRHLEDSLERARALLLENG